MYLWDQSHTDRQTTSQVDRWTDRLIDRQANRRMDRQTDKLREMRQKSMSPDVVKSMIKVWCR